MKRFFLRGSSEQQVGAGGRSKNREGAARYEYVAASDTQVEALRRAAKEVWVLSQLAATDSPRRIGTTTFRFVDVLGEAQLAERESPAKGGRITIARELGGWTVSELFHEPAKEFLASPSAAALEVTKVSYPLEGDLTSTQESYLAILRPNGDFARERTLSERHSMPISTAKATQLTNFFEHFVQMQDTAA